MLLQAAIITVCLVPWLQSPDPLRPAADPPQQPALPPAAAADQAEIPPDGSTWLNESFDAYEALRRIDEHAARADWSAALDAAADARRRFPTAVCRLDDDRFIALGDRISRLIAAWPPEGLAALQRRTAAEAARRLDDARAARSLDALVQLAEDHYPAAVAADAIETAAQIAFEAGDFAFVRQWLDRLLTDHPLRRQREPLWKPLLAIARAWEGRPDELRRLVEARRQAPERIDQADGSPWTATWAGREADLSALARAALAAPGARPPAPTPWNHPLRTGVVASSARPEARLWRFELTADTAAADAGRRDDALWADESPAAVDDATPTTASARRLALQPAVGDGIVVVHDYRSVWAIDTQRPHAPAWRFDLVDEPAAADAGGAPPDRAWGSEDDPPPLFTTTLDDQQVFVHLDRRPPDRLGAGGGAGQSSSLVCLDLGTGRPLWRSDLLQLRTEFDETRLDGAPLVVRDKLLAVVRRRKPFGFEACYLAAFDPRDGRLLWSTHLGEAATGGYGYHRATLTCPAADGDLVFVQTNLGAVAAVSVSTGTIRWVRLYRPWPNVVAGGFWPGRMGQRARPWHYLPTLIWGDRMVAAPLDCDSLLVIDQATGRLISETPLTLLRNPETIAGPREDHLYLVGSWVVCWDLADGRLVWERQLPAGELFGRPALGSEGLLVPTTAALLRYPLDGGVPSVYPWEPRDAGNVVVVGDAAAESSALGPHAPGVEPAGRMHDQIIVAAESAVYGLVRKEDAFERLESRMAANPGDPGAALALAELAFQTREHSRGLRALDECIRRAGGLARIADERLRRRLFNACIRFADEFRADPAPADPDAGVPPEIALLEKAGQLSLEAPDQVLFRMRLADAHARRGQVAGAVETWQQILTDPSLRAAPLPAEARPPADDDDVVIPGAPAGPFARQRIDRLIAEHGRDVYAAIERQARLRLTSAREARDDQALQRVADAYPNSPVAPAAHVARGRLLAGDARHEAAAKAFRRALDYAGFFDPPSRRSPPEGDAIVLPDRVVVTRELIDSLVLAGRIDAADEWLARASRDFPAARFEHAGRTVTFREYRAQLLADTPPAAPRPRIDAPLAHAWSRTFDDRPLILTPRFDRLPATTWNTCLTWCRGRIEALDPRTGQSLWPEPVASRTPPVLLGMDAERFIFANPHQVLAVDQRSGRVAWTLGEYPAAADEPGADPEWVTTWIDHALTATDLYSAQDRGILFRVRLADGRTVWRTDPEPPVGGPLVATDRFVAYAARPGRSNRIVVCDGKSGRRLHLLELDDDRALLALRLTPDGTIVVVTARHIWAFDATAGIRRWKAASASRHVASAIRVGPEGVYAATESGRVTCYGLDDGRVIWTSRPVPAQAGVNPWIESAAGIIYAAGRHALLALDSADGRPVWTAVGERVFPCRVEIARPLLTESDLLAITTAVPDQRGRPDAPAAAAAAEPDLPDAPEFRLHRFSLDDGRGIPAGPAGPLPLGRPSRFRGVFAFDGAVIVLDGASLTGYRAP